MSKSTEQNAVGTAAIATNASWFLAGLILLALTGLASAAPLWWIKPEPFGGMIGLGKDLVTAVIDRSSSYLYFRNRGTVSQPAQSIKMRIGDDDELPEFVAVVDVSSPEYLGAQAFTEEDQSSPGNSVAVVLADGRRFFYRYESGAVEEYAPRSKELVGRIAIPRGSGYLRAAGCLLVDQEQKALYVGTARGPTSPAQVVKIAVGNGKEPARLIGAIDLNPDESNIRCGVLDSTNQFALFATDKQIVKVALNDGDALPTRMGAVSLLHSEHTPKFAVHDGKHGHTYFANKDSIVKVRPGSAGDIPVRIGGVTIGRGDANVSSFPWLVGSIVPLVIAAFFGPGPITQPVRLLFTSMFVASIVVAMVHMTILSSRGVTGLAAAIPPLIVPFFFLLPLCATLLNVVEKGHRSLAAGIEFTAAFRGEMIQPLIIGALIWILFIIGLEGIGLFVVHGRTLIVSAFVIGLASGMVFGSLLWISRCKSLRSLGLLASVTGCLLMAVAMALSVAFIALMGWDGYMGLGYLFAPVPAAAVMLFFTLLLSWFVSQQGSSWFVSAIRDR